MKQQQEEQLAGIPDYLDYGLKILFIGFNPGLKSALTGHHYANPSNRFWKLLHQSGLTPYQFKPEEEGKLLKLGYGLTNIVSRPTRRASEIMRAEYEEGRELLKKRLRKYSPCIACYTGIGVYRQFSGLKQFHRGLQEYSLVEGVKDFVISSPSGLNRIPFTEQLAHYQELKILSESC